MTKYDLEKKLFLIRIKEIIINNNNNNNNDNNNNNNK